MTVEGRLALLVVSSGGEVAVDYLHRMVSGEPPQGLRRGSALVVDRVWPAGDFVL